MTSVRKRGKEEISTHGYPATGAFGALPGLPAFEPGVNQVSTKAADQVLILTVIWTTKLKNGF